MVGHQEEMVTPRNFDAGVKKNGSVFQKKLPLCYFVLYNDVI